MNTENFEFLEGPKRSNRMPDGFFVIGTYRYDDKPNVKTIIISSELMERACFSFGDRVRIGFKFEEGQAVVVVRRVVGTGYTISKSGGNGLRCKKGVIKFVETDEKRSQLPDAVFSESDIETSFGEIIAIGEIIATENNGFIWL